MNFQLLDSLSLPGDPTKSNEDAFGQGVGVSELQMAVAFCAIANDGRLLRPGSPSSGRGG
jgi:hypothetical protein